MIQRIKSMMFVAAAIGLIFGCAFGGYAAETGKAAPEFKAVDISGAEQSLDEYQGKIVVLEWFNPECPFVIKHYHSGNMQSLQKKYTEAGVVWLTINSSTEGKQGYLSPEEAGKVMKEKKSSATAFILDSGGSLGRLYEAKTTPHMYVIDAKGILRYQGAIDSKPTWKEEDIAESENYVAAALDALLAGKPVQQGSTIPYGCSVKYAD